MNDHALVREFCRRHQLSNAFNTQCIRQLMSAVEFLHQRMIIHGDIQPPKILLRNGELQAKSSLCMPIQYATDIENLIVKNVRLRFYEKL